MYNPQSNGNTVVEKLEFNTIKEFNDQRNGGNVTSFEVSFRIKTSEAQDNRMIEGSKKGENSTYQGKGNNCADLARYPETLEISIMEINKLRWE